MFRVKNVKQMILFIVISIIIFLLFNSFFIDIMNFFARNINQKAIIERIYEIINVIENKNINDTVDLRVRLEKYIVSIETFFRDPLGFDSDKIIGEHSELLDEYARYGIILASITVLPIYTYIKFISNELKSLGKKRIWFVISIIYLVFNVINTTMFISTNILVFFVTPAIIYLSKEKNNEIN